MLELELTRRFGHTAFRPGQRTLIEALLAKRDALGVLPTGGGKSLCFQLPATLLEGTAIIVSPLVALMKDQVDALRARGIAAEAYNSSLSQDEKRRAYEALCEGRVKLLYMAPERIQHESFLAMLGRIGVSFLAIDEAHCISHWGHDFRPEYRRLAELRTLLPKVPVIALTATATQQVQEDIAAGLKMIDPVKVVTGFRRPNLAFEVVQTPSRAHKLRTIERLAGEALDRGGSAIIYAATRKNVEKVAGDLAGGKLGKNVTYYHAGLGDKVRTRAQDDFLFGKKRVLVATNAFGMGIDKHDVRLVLHFDVPGSVEAYYQEAGRAGRDGEPSRCSLLFCYADVATQEFFIDKSSEELRDSGADEETVEARERSQRSLLKQLVRYAYSTQCRQRVVLGYFGDPDAGTPCGNCDRCMPTEVPRAPADEKLTIAARQALSTVARLNGRYGKVRITEVLKGSRSQALLASGLESQPTYGCLGAWTLERVRALVDNLIEAGLLKMTGIDYPLIALTSEGVLVMKGEKPVELAASEAFAPKREADSGLLAALKELRAGEARERNVPPFMVFHDRTLAEVAASRPGDLTALSEVSGFGPRKLELYGEAVLELIRTRAPSSAPAESS